MEFSKQDEDNKLIFLVQDNSILTQNLDSEISNFGYIVHKFTQISELKNALEQTLPSAIILDINPSNNSPNNNKIITEVQEKHKVPIPIIFISNKGEIVVRLQAVRTGASAYFTKPIDINELVDKLDVLTFQQTPEPYRILIVEDEPELAKSYALTLQEAGMITEMITDPIQIMQPLSEFKPDLILMDVYMPVCNGIELTKVIRQQETFVSIPIVFLSSEFNPDKQLAAMRLGGDDFLTKPIHAEHLISAVTSRVQRLRTLRSFMVKDSLTGLLNHTEIKKQLDTEVSRARRENRKFSFAMIDIDHFKSINDTYGHPTGDRVLKSLSRFLQQRLRKTDIIGRYGGEEFAMILLGADGPAAEKVMNKIRIDFSKVRQQAEQTEFFISFSCGIAPFPEFSDSTLINDIADKALYRAKESGRNQVVLSSK